MESNVTVKDYNQMDRILREERMHIAKMVQHFTFISSLIERLKDQYRLASVIPYFSLFFIEILNFKFT